MFKKKIGIFALTFAMAAMSMTGCGQANTDKTDTAADTAVSAEKTNGDTFSVVCTIFPEYDWVKEILGDHADDAEITYLLDSGVDLHSYQPTADDILKISSCDMFVYVGGESDEWVENALADAQHSHLHADASTRCRCHRFSGSHACPAHRSLSGLARLCRRLYSVGFGRQYLGHRTHLLPQGQVQARGARLFLAVRYARGALGWLGQSAPLRSMLDHTAKYRGP